VYVLVYYYYCALTTAQISLASSNRPENSSNILEITQKIFAL